MQVVSMRRIADSCKNFTCITGMHGTVWYRIIDCSETFVQYKPFYSITHAIAFWPSYCPYLLWLWLYKYTAVQIIKIFPA